MSEPARVSLRAQPTWRGVIALAIGLTLLSLGLRWHYAGVVALGVGLLALCAAAAVSVLVPAPIVPERRVAPLRVVRNGSCRAVLRVRSTGRRFAVRLDAAERIGDSLVPIVVPRLPPGGAVEASYEIPTSRRGVVSVGPLRLQRVGTAGLAVARGVAGGTVKVHVLPRVLQVLGLPSGAKRGHVGADERVERGGTDLLALREYVPGDDLRRVHWATSARSGTLMIREDADPARPYLTVLIDDRASSYTGDQLEEAVEVAASLVTAAVDAGHPVQLFSISHTVDLDVPASAPGMAAAGAEDLLRTLAELRAVPGAVEPVPLPIRELDVVVTVTGAAAPLAPLLAEAGRAPYGIAMVVDDRSARVDAEGSVLILRGPRAEDLLQSWDVAVLR